MPVEQVDSPAVFEYLEKNLNADPATFALQKHPFSIPVQELARQLSGLKTARKKFPDLLYGPGLRYPQGLNLEQTSSQQTAMYKAGLVNAGKVLDLTGGLGVDSIAFAKANKTTVTHLEKNPELQKIAEHNFKTLGLPIQSIEAHAEEFISSTSNHYDLVFIDPARRDEYQKKVIQINECEPDITTLMPDLFKIAPRVMVKLSPMLDIAQALRDLPNVKEIHAVAVRNELKELLLILEQGFEGKLVAKAINLDTEQPEVEVPYPSRVCKRIGRPKQFLYEPNAACNKLQCYGALASTFDLDQLAVNTHLFIGDVKVDFPGRCFEVVQVEKFSRKRFKKNYAGKNYGVVSKNLNGIGILGSVRAMRKHFQLGEHETDYLFLTRLENGDKVVIEARKISGR